MAIVVEAEFFSLCKNLKFNKKKKLNIGFLAE